MAVQTSYAERHGVATPGLIADQVPNTRISRTMESASAGFGLAVSKGTADRGCVLGGTLAGFLGVTVKDITLIPTTTSNQDLFLRYQDTNILSDGQVWVSPETSVADGDVVFFDATTGRFGASRGTAAAAAASGTGNSGDGTYTAASPALATDAQVGTWIVQLVSAASNGGLFAVTRPDGTIDGYAKVGVAYDGGLKFTIADGNADFALGDKFTVAVSLTGGKIGPIPGARWSDTALASGLAKIHLGISKN